MSDIEERLRRLERDNRVLRGLLIAAAAVAAVVWGGRADAQGDKGVAPTVRSRSFVVVDEKGNRRAVLGMAKDGVGLVFFDEKERREAILGSTDDGTNLTLFEGPVRRAMLQLKDGTPSLRLYDEKGQGGAVVQVAKGRPAVVLLADDERSQATMALFDTGPRMQFKHNNQGTMVLASTRLGTRMEMIHEPGRPALYLSATPTNARFGWVQGKEDRGALVLDDTAQIPAFVDGAGRPLLPRMLPRK